MTELQLSNKEMRQLAKFSCKCLEEWKADKLQGFEDLSRWYGIQFDKRMFDLNLWDDEEGNIVCTAYEKIVDKKIGPQILTLKNFYGA